jgi:TPP-dependent trihydroxycyclohexane-1,2-dione (THcHDO) dehydratase
VFTIFGHGNVLGLGQALEQDSGDLVVHQGRNEQGMAHAAIGFAKQHLRRKIYACTASVGPGAANMLTAAATPPPIASRCCCCPAMCMPAASPTRCCNRSNSSTT